MRLLGKGIFNQLARVQAFRWLYGGTWQQTRIAYEKDCWWTEEEILPVCELVPLEILQTEMWGSWGDRLNTVVEKFKTH